VIGGAGGTDLTAARTRISHWASGAQAWLGADSPQTEGSAPTPSTTQLASLPDSSHLLPPPLGPTLLATIASTLASSRQKQPARQPPKLTFRWTLSTILNHYFPHKFGQQMEDGVITYARDPASDAALQSYHERISHMRFSSGEDDEPTTPLDFEADRAEGIRAATLSIAKRDEKMRWLLGGKFNLELQRAARRLSPSVKADKAGACRLRHEEAKCVDSDCRLSIPQRTSRIDRLQGTRAEVTTALRRLSPSPTPAATKTLTQPSTRPTSPGDSRSAHSTRPSPSRATRAQSRPLHPARHFSTPNRPPARGA
jgi:hypothetical protein